jgi:hypothetical protein
MRHLTEGATPEQIARTNELLAAIRRWSAMMGAWEQGYLDAGGTLGEDENPYRGRFDAAVAEYNEYRAGRTP